MQLILNSCLFSENMPDSNIEGGTFRMSDLKSNSDNDDLNDDIISPSNNLITYSKDNSTDLH